MGGAEMKSPVVKRSIRIAGHKTSISLEDDFWRALKEIAGERHKSLSALVAAIEGDRQHSNLSSAIRLFVLEFYRSRATKRPCDGPLPQGRRSSPSPWRVLAPGEGRRVQRIPDTAGAWCRAPPKRDGSSRDASMRRESIGPRSLGSRL